MAASKKKCPGKNCEKMILAKDIFCSKCERNNSSSSARKQNILPTVSSSVPKLTTSLFSRQTDSSPTEHTNLSSSSNAIKPQNSALSHNNASFLPPIDNACFYQGGNPSNKSNINQPTDEMDDGKQRCFVYAPLAAHEICGAKYKQSDIDTLADKLFSKIGGGCTGKGEKTFEKIGLESLSVNTSFKTKWKKMVKYAIKNNVAICLGISWESIKANVVGQHVIYVIGYINNDLYAPDQQNQHTEICISMKDWACEKFKVYKFKAVAYRKCKVDFISFGGTPNHINELESLKRS